MSAADAISTLREVTAPLKNPPRRRGQLVGVVGLALALGFTATGVHSLEVFRTHAELLRSAPVIVHARVESFRPVGGVGQLFEFTVTRIEEIRGTVPATFRVRLALASRVIDPDGLPDAPGSDWVLMLERTPTSEGYYLLHSMNYGKVELMLRMADGALVLARPLPPEEGGSLRYYSLQQFKDLVRRIGGPHTPRR